MLDYIVMEVVVPLVEHVVEQALNPEVHSQDDGVLISCNLAASYGNLKDCYKIIDNEMKVN